MSRSSLIHRIATVVGAITLIALGNMLVSFTISSSIQGSATAINLAGALRLHSYSLLVDAHEASAGTVSLRTRDNSPGSFTSKLQDPTLLDALPADAGHRLRQQHAVVVDTWTSRLLPLLQAAPAGTSLSRLRQETEVFVSSINGLVSLLEQQTEARIRLMNLVQIVSLVLTVLIVIVLFVDLKRRIIRPMSRLVAIAGAVAQKDFSQKANLTGADELSRLGQAFDQMSSRLSLSYHELEREAHAKTVELERSHAAMELLHRASRSLYAGRDLCHGAVPMLQELEQLLEVGPIRLFLHDKDMPEPVQVLTTAASRRPDYCRDHSCGACVVTAEEFEALPLQGEAGRCLLLPIRTTGQLLGTLEVWYPIETGLPKASRRLLETLSDQLATAIYIEQKTIEEQQLTLSQERTVIARELHDSLAQSLTYLKMQVARLQRLKITGDHEAMHTDILQELTTGLNSAYRQLRELLTTFRLKLDAPDLASGFRQTVDEFSERLGQPIRLDYKLPARLLSPNEEIHVLQIVREALANAVRHSAATEVVVEVGFVAPMVQVRITDNGVGLPEGRPPQHYGLIIMEDRARTLGGSLQVTSSEGGGVSVAFGFIPRSRSASTPQATPPQNLIQTTSRDHYG